MRWFDIDYPDGIDLRRRLYPARNDGYQMISASATEPGWLDHVLCGRPLAGQPDGSAADRFVDAFARYG